MKLNKHKKGITTVEDWKRACPPKKDSLQWKDGRSAKELARYITGSFPAVPDKIENALKTLVPIESSFDWDAEYVTDLPGKGEGRNHDAILYNDDIVVTIEAKADEPLGELVKKELKNASVNKLHRISELLRILFKGGFTGYEELRYQLLTASVGTILEAESKRLNTAVLIVLVFKTEKTEEFKINENHKSIEDFLKATNATEEKGFWVIPNNTDVKLYFKEIVI